MGKRRLKERRTIIIRLYTLLGILGLVVLFGGATYGVWRPEVRVENISVSGLEVIEPHKIGDAVKELIAGSYFHIFPKDSIFLLPVEEVKETLLVTFPRLESIEVSKTGFKDIELSAIERIGSYMWCGVSTSTPCLLTDSTGFIFAEEEKDLPKVYGRLAHEGSPLANTVFEENALEKVHILNEALKEVGVSVVRVEFVEPDEVLLTLSSGPVVQYVLGEEEIIAETFPSVLDGIENLEEIEYIDMRFGKRVYIKRNE
ncbi:MAG: cell division protein FtsQ/DivIB [Patescibacteria group bacterium UBA2103]